MRLKRLSFDIVVDTGVDIVVDVDDGMNLVPHDDHGSNAQRPVCNTHSLLNIAFEKRHNLPPIPKHVICTWSSS